MTSDELHAMTQEERLAASGEMDWECRFWWAWYALVGLEARFEARECRALLEDVRPDPKVMTQAHIEARAGVLQAEAKRAWIRKQKREAYGRRKEGD